MADVADRAQLVQERHLEVALRAARASLPTGRGLLTCSSCGEDIEIARRQAMPGCELCIDCQSAIERGMGR